MSTDNDRFPDSFSAPLNNDAVPTIDADSSATESFEAPEVEPSITTPDQPTSWANPDDAGMASHSPASTEQQAAPDHLTREYTTPLAVERDSVAQNAATEDISAVTARINSQTEPYATPLQPEQGPVAPVTQTPTIVAGSAGAGSAFAGLNSAPVPPKKKGNRGGGVLIALLATLAFAVIYLAVVAAIFLLSGVEESLSEDLARFSFHPAFIGPVVAFAVGLIVIVVLANRARWWAYVLGGFVVAVVVYAASIIGAAVSVNGWVFDITTHQDFVISILGDPLPVFAAIVAREVTVWFGAWIAARGRKVTAKNAEELTQFENRVSEAANPALAPSAEGAW